jgi:hypothetical protein
LLCFICDKIIDPRKALLVVAMPSNCMHGSYFCAVKATAEAKFNCFFNSGISNINDENCFLNIGDTSIRFVEQKRRKKIPSSAGLVRQK